MIDRKGVMIYSCGTSNEFEFWNLARGGMQKQKHAQINTYTTTHKDTHNARLYHRVQDN